MRCVANPAEKLAEMLDFAKKFSAAHPDHFWEALAPEVDVGRLNPEEHVWMLDAGDRQLETPNPQRSVAMLDGSSWTLDRHGRLKTREPVGRGNPVLGILVRKA